MIKKIIIVLVSILILLFSSLLVSLKSISNLIGKPLFYLPSLIVTYQTYHPQVPTNFLILGLDPRNDSLEKTEVTDTIIFSQINGSRINLVSLPRDLWSYPLGKKINQIYPLSLGQANPYQYIVSQYQSIVGQSIDRVLIITTQNLIDLTQIIGGADLYLPQGFTDTKYPNPDYITHPSPKTPIYKTVKFDSGWIHLDTSNITEFVRSRKGAETAAEGGTDIGREQRQQLLIDALITKLKSPTITKNPTQITALYKFFHSEIRTNLSDQDLINLALHYKTDLLNFSLHKVIIPTGENPKTDILYHPAKFINPQWVFIPQDKNYQSLHEFIRSQFAILNY